MKKDRAIRNKAAALAKAKAELSAFKNKDVIDQTPPWKELLTMLNARETAKREENTAYKDLWCSNQPGEISQAKFELTKDEARVYEAIKLTKSSIPSPSQGNDKTSFMSRKLAFHHKWDGCPHCKNRGFIFCNNCETLSCWDNPKDGWHECPNCKNGARAGKGGITLKIENTKPTHALSGQKSNKALPKSKGKGLAFLPRK